MARHSRGFIALNVIRGFSVIALCMAIVASITHLVKSFILSKYFLFDVLNNFLLALFCTFLLISETPLLSTYYKRRWPLFGPDSSLVSIGVAEVIVGFQLLGMVNDKVDEEEDETAVIISFNKILMASGALICATGAIVFIANFVFCNSQTHTTARTIRAISKESKDTRNPSALGRVVVDAGSAIERPQRTFSKASRVAPAGHELERTSSQNVEMVSRRPSVAPSSSRGAFPYVTAFTPPPARPPPPDGESRMSWVEGSEVGFSQSQYTEVRPTPPAKYGAPGNPYAKSEAGGSSYSSKPSPSEYRVKGNPYTRIEE